MSLNDRYNELLKLKRKQLFDLLQKRYDQICTLHDLVAEKNPATAHVLWQSESKSAEYRFSGKTISLIKYTIDERPRMDNKAAAHGIVIAELFIQTYEKALSELSAGRRVTERKSLSITLPIEYWHLIDQICHNKDISYAGFFRQVVAKELGDSDGASD